MELFGSNFNFFGSRQKREATPTPPSGAPGVPSSTMEQEGQKVSGGDFQERIVTARSPEQALLVASVYRAVTLRSDVMSVMPVQYREKDFERGNFYVKNKGLGKRLNYLLQVEPNPIMTAPDMWRLVEINRLFYGNAFIYIERDEFELPARLWLVKSGSYNLSTGRYINITYLTDYGYQTKVDVPRRDVMHFANTFRYQNGIWGIPTLQYAIETLSLNRTLKQQSLETAAKGGRVKLIIGEEKPAQGAGTLAFGLMAKGEMDKYAEELQRKMYNGHDILAIRGLDKVQNISMTSAEMQLFEQLGATNDDVSRFFGVPRPLLMLDTNSHYTSYSDATMEFHTRTILPLKHLNEIEIYRKITRDPVKEYGVTQIHICEDLLMAMDPERRAKVVGEKLAAGLCTVNEGRQEFDMPSVENGDEPMASANLMTLKALIAKSEAATELKPGNYTVATPKNENENQNEEK